jgi:hypothetical protein
VAAAVVVAVNVYVTLYADAACNACNADEKASGVVAEVAASFDKRLKFPSVPCFLHWQIVRFPPKAIQQGQFLSISFI